MKITREVIYDLLPAYFANEVSTDTRTLIDDSSPMTPSSGAWRHDFGRSSVKSKDRRSRRPMRHANALPSTVRVLRRSCQSKLVPRRSHGHWRRYSPV